MALVTGKNPIFQLKTINGKVFKCLSDSLRAVLTDVNIIIDKTGLRMMAVDVNNVGAMHLEMPNSAFESFYCDDEAIYQGLNIVKLARILKICNVKDKLVLSIYDDRKRIEVSIENSTEHKMYKQYIALDAYSEINVQLPDFDIQPPEMISSELLKICRQMSTVGSKTVDIQMINDDLSFTGGGGGDAFPSFHMKIGPPTTCDHMVSATFMLQFLQTFSKAADISNKVRLHIEVKPGMKPLLILAYDMSGMGQLRYLMTGTDLEVEEETTGVDDEDSGFEYDE